MRRLKWIAALILAAAVDTAEGVRSASSTVNGNLAAHRGDESNGLELTPEMSDSELLAWQARRANAKPPSRLLRAFRFVMSGFGSPGEAKISQQSAKNSLLQEQYHALAGLGHIKTDCQLKKQQHPANSTASLLQLHLQSQEAVHLEEFAQLVMKALKGDDDPGENLPQDPADRQDIPKNVKPSFRQRLQRAWEATRSIRTSANMFLNVAAALNGGNPVIDPCFLKILYSFYLHEGEDDYPYFPKGCGIDNFGEVMETDNSR